MIASIDKVQRRLNVLEENNVGQQELEQFLLKSDKRKKELNITIPLHGHINLAILNEKGFRNVQHIIFHEQGDITSIVNIPEKVKILSCQHNLLEELKDLPEGLDELHVSNNMIHTLDLSRCKRLKKLYCSYNKLTSLSGLAETLRNLYVDHNQLKTLDLAPNIRLKILHCQNNPHLVLQNIPSTIVEGIYPEKIVQEHHKPEEDTTEGLNETLNRYFRIKSKYEGELMDIRRDKKKNLPKCQGCEKTVGMVFSQDASKYDVRCGGNPPCEWNIVIHKGKYQNREEVINMYLETIDELKEEIIHQKMATLFHHMGEKKAAEQFEDKMKAYKTANEFYEKLKTKHEELHYNEEKMTEIKEKQKLIHNNLKKIKESLREGDVEEAVKTQYKLIAPLSQYIQKLQYEIMECEKIYNVNGKLEKNVIYLEPFHYSKLEVNLGETPSVV